MRLRRTQAATGMKTRARSSIGLGIAAALVACVFSLPARASTASCSSLTPTDTGCAVVDASFNNASQDIIGGSSFNGTFTADDDLQVFAITITTPDVLSAQSFS